MADYSLKKRQYRLYYQKISPIFKKPEVKAYTMAILSFFCMSFFGFFAIRPTLVTITQLRRKIEDSKALDQKLEQKINLVVKAQKEYEIIKGALPAINNTIPESPNFVVVLKALENLAQENSASISSIQVSSVTLAGEKNPSSEPSGLQKLEVAFSLSGDYQAIENFLKGLSSLRRIVLINNLTVNKKTTSDQLNLTLKMDAYYTLKQEKNE